MNFGKKSTSIKKDDEFNTGKFGRETGCQPPDDFKMGDGRRESRDG